tara:strand:+ start:57 stop:350 length:294 start_codon:yes stop_codon:yes gene_type:complete
MKSIFILLDNIITIYLWIVIINAILSWLVAFNILNTQNRFVFSVLDATYKMTDPALNKIRRFIPTFGSIDVSPVVLILLLMFLRNVIFEIFAPAGLF